LEKDGGGLIMEKKIVLLKDLTPDTVFPVVDLLNSEGVRLGCATTALINFIMKMGLFEKMDFSNVAEMALYYEQEFEKDSLDGVKPTRFAKVIDELTPKLPIEKYILRADIARYEDILFLLANDFVGLVCGNTGSEHGHCDIIFKDEDDKVFYNSFEVNVEQLAELLFPDQHSMILLARNLEKHPRLFMKTREMANLTLKLTDEQKYMLQKSEIFYAENVLLAIVDKYPLMEIPAILKEKEDLLKRLGTIHERTIIIDK
jgi:hypothetical protein